MCTMRRPMGPPRTVRTAPTRRTKVANMRVQKDANIPHVVLFLLTVYMLDSRARSAMTSWTFLRIMSAKRRRWRSERFRRRIWFGFS